VQTLATIRKSAKTRHLQPSLFGFAIAALLIACVFFLLPMGFIASWMHTEEKTALAALADVALARLVRIVFWNTVEISVCAALISVLLAYPVALHIVRQQARWKIFCLALVLMPFWTSILVKSYAFLVLLGDDGALNAVVRSVFGGRGLNMLFNRFAVMVGMTNFLVPYAVFPILASLVAQNMQIQRAAEVMGAVPLHIFWKITFVQSLPGVLAALLMCMVISMGFFVTPALLGGRGDMMIANLIDLYTREILDWQSAALISLMLLGFSAVLAVGIFRFQARVGG